MKQIESRVVSREQIESYENASYRVTTIIPFEDSTKLNTYLMSHDELQDLFENYMDFEEFVVSVVRAEEA